MKLSKILCAIDLEHKVTEKVVEASSFLAKNFGSELIILNVVEKEIPLLLAEEIIALSPDIKTLDEIFEGIKKKAYIKVEAIAKDVENKYNIAPRCLVEIGETIDTILDVAKKENVDLIIVGSHGKSGLEKLLIGSVSESVVKRAKCSVLVIKGGS
ncbi:MAG: universal stress protein [Thermosulfidibacteraceae bacterium]|jgi:nucleotide-binding universal stress UspA family protein